MALSRKLLVITSAAKHDLADAAKRLERLMNDLRPRSRHRRKSVTIECVAAQG
ncbi:hypothetical protein SANTM175S_00901 [Streptomyces antimycoticus]